MKTWLTLTLLLGSLLAQADEAVIRKNIGERIPQFPRIDEVSKSPIPGLFELRVNGVEIFYTDGDANFLIQGNIIDTRQRRNLTEERIEKLSALDFETLPFKDAFTIVRGNGKRRLAVFEDPNCGYCKRLERDLQKVDNVSLHIFLLPILGPDSVEKSKNVWCSRDKAKAWLDLMIREQAPPAQACDTTALNRNLEFGRKYKVTGTPTMIFADGSRVPGAISAQQLEKLLSERVAAAPKN